MNVLDNEFLIVDDDVKLTPVIIPVICGADKIFKREGLKSRVTSGLRTSRDQLDTIVKYCKRYNIDAEFPEILTCGINDKIDFGQSGKIYTWARAWSKLLEIGVIINPPFPAKCLFDYWRDGRNKKGQMIGHSPHYYGNAFDNGGGLDHDITNELVCWEIAKREKLPGFKFALPERKNNCVHIDCVPI